MNWIPVKSSNIMEVAFREGNIKAGGMEGVLSVKFTKSGIYHYMDVPEKVFTEMLEAESVGKFFAERVKNRFEYVKDQKKEVEK